jgi:hypothetical protein
LATATGTCPSSARHGLRSRPLGDLADSGRTGFIIRDKNMLMSAKHLYPSSDAEIH